MPENPAYYDVLSLLVNGGFGTLGSELFGGEWGDPDSQILVKEGVGFPVDQAEIYQQPGVQVLVRGDVLEADLDVYRRAKQVSDYLLTLSDATEINGVCYRGFEEGSTIGPLGKDENERFIYSMNFYTYRNRL